MHSYFCMDCGNSSSTNGYVERCSCCNSYKIVQSEDKYLAMLVSWLLNIPGFSFIANDREKIPDYSYLAKLCNDYKNREERMKENPEALCTDCQDYMALGACGHCRAHGMMVKGECQRCVDYFIPRNNKDNC